MEKRENKPAKSLSSHLKELGLSPSCANQTFFQMMNWGREMEMVVESSNQTQKSNVGQDCCPEKTQLPRGYGLIWLTC